jgi:P4 family phage/plasmid primase-like protien
VTLELVPPPDSEPDAPDDVQPRTTDAGNARAFLDASDAYRYVVQWETWLHWTGTHWQREGAHLSLFNDLLGVIQAEYAAQLDTVTRLRRERIEIARRGIGTPELDAATAALEAAVSVLKFLHASQNTAKLKSAIEQLKAPLALEMSRLDSDPWLLNCANGTVDLRTADLRPHAREDFITQFLPTPFDLHAKAPAWAAFLDQCMKGSHFLTLYLQRLVGYTLTASTQEHLLVFCYGSGANGKSTFLRVLQDLLGPYGCATPRTLLFTSRPGEVHPTELATLYGMRLGVCSEVGEDAALDEPKVKDLTGGDPISCRRMHENFWRFAPTHKLWLAGNHKPVIKGTDNGIWRRLRVVPWTVSFAAEAQDKELAAKLRAELPGILAWAVQGCLEWRRIGVCDPPEVTAATSSYRTQSDALGEFFRSHLVFAPEAKMAAKHLRSLYERWCEDMGHLPAGARKVGQRLRGAPYNVTESTTRIDGKVVAAWAGVRQLAEFESPQPLLADQPPPT